MEGRPTTSTCIKRIGMLEEELKEGSFMLEEEELKEGSLMLEEELNEGSFMSMKSRDE